MIAFYLNMIETEDDKNKFERVYYEYRKRMLFVANKVLHDRYEAEDAVQNALIGIAKNIHMIKEVESKDTFSYVMKAAYNAALDLSAKSRKRKEVVNIDGLYDLSDEGFLEELDLANSYNEVVEAIKNMKEIYRDVLFFYFVKDMTVKEIANLLNKSTGTVSSQISRGKRILLDSLKKGEFYNGID